MKPKNLKEAYKQIRKIIKRICGEYNYNFFIIGDLNNNKYVQFVPVLEVYFYNNNGELTVERLNGQDMRKLARSPKGTDWRSQLLGKSKFPKE